MKHIIPLGVILLQTLLLGELKKSDDRGDSLHWHHLLDFNARLHFRCRNNVDKQPWAITPEIMSQNLSSNKLIFSELCHTEI